MTKIGISRGLLLGATVAFVVGCGGTTTPSDAGTSGCSNDAACGTGKVCHPVLKTCFAACTSGSECTATSERLCARFDGSTGSTSSPGFCQCQTNELCNTAIPGNVCNAAIKQCSAKCTSNSSCPSGSSCNVTSGVCGAATTVDGGTDAGVDAGMAMDAGVACNSNNPQPDVCGYSNACNSNMGCQPAADDRCQNITAAINAGRYTAWNPTTGTGPVIFSNSELTAETAGCAGNTDVPFTVTLFAYSGSTPFPTNITAWPGFKYFTSTGTAVDIPGNLVGNVSFPYANFVLSNNNKNAAITMTLCAPAGSTTLTAGFAFTNGNAYCASLTR